MSSKQSVIYDLTKIRADSNAEYAFKLAMEKAIETDSDYIMNPDGSVLSFEVTNSAPFINGKLPKKTKNNIINILRNTPIRGKYYDFFEIEPCKCSHDGFSSAKIKVIKYAIPDIILQNKSYITAEISSFWADLENDYKKGLLLRTKANCIGQNYLANINGRIKCLLYFNLKYSAIDDHIKSKFKDLLNCIFRELNPGFKYNHLTFKFKTTERPKTVAIHIYIE